MKNDTNDTITSEGPLLGYLAAADVVALHSLVMQLLARVRRARAPCGGVRQRHLPTQHTRVQGFG